jgi:hypothetical protein
MRKQQNVLKLSSAERTDFLNQHLPNRVAAAWIWLPNIAGEWEWKLRRDFAENADNNQVWCIGRAAEHGQKAAMRWLIEFVGIRLNPQEMPDRPIRHKTDVSIQSFVDDGSDLQIVLDTTDNSSKAWILARVWDGCTKSCVHSTFNTNHHRADPPQLAEALTIIVEHLQEKLYKSGGGKRLNKIVREQH